MKTDIEVEAGVGSGEATVSLARAGRRVNATSPGFAALLGYGPNELDNLDLAVVVHPSDVELFEAALQTFFDENEATQVEVRLMEGGGSYVRVRALIHASTEDPDSFLVALEPMDDYVTWDGAQADPSAEQPNYQVYQEEVAPEEFGFDPVTMLRQRDYLLHEYELLRPRLGRDVPRAALIVVDVDRFSVIERAIGSGGAGAVLKVVGHRLEDSLGADQILVHLEIDRFGILAAGIADQEAAEVLTRSLRAVLDSPVVAPEGEEVVVTASIGVALLSDPGLDAHEAISHAMAAKERAKSRGPARVEFYSNKESARDARARKTFENEVRRAVDSEDLALLFQPIYSLDSGRIGGVEALVRMRHPDRGMLFPAEFMQVAKEIGRLPRVGTFVISSALDALAGWLRTYPNSGLALNINLTGDELDEPEVTNALIERVQALELLQGSVYVELSDIHPDLDCTCHDSVASIGAAGIALSVDEFGSGASALAVFSRYDVAQVKLGRAMVLGLEENSRSWGVLSGLVELAHSLKAEVVGIGVEKAGQIRLMRKLGIDKVQGFHLGYPMDRDQIESQLELVAE
ncbi:MAG: GGDEF and EAL domain-containing protein [Actinomycetota bacterium]|nr:GGDEF and EAL domain-containing protein [Actinomycetota bacterium]